MTVDARVLAAAERGVACDCEREMPMSCTSPVYDGERADDWRAAVAVATQDALIESTLTNELLYGRTIAHQDASH